MPRPFSFALAAASAAVLLLGTASPGIAQDKVGVKSAVNPQAVGTPPGGSSRPLVIGQEVVFNERIATQEAGQTQLLFVDESALSIGPNSDMTIDQFVYDPKSGNGKLAMSATKGVLRFVGGKLSKQENAVTMATPSANLAIRGGIFLAEIEPDGALTVVLIYGIELTVTGQNGATTTIKRPGFAVRVERPGAPPSMPLRIEHEKLATLTAQFEGRVSADGGARIRPTDEKVTATALYRELARHAELAREREAEFHRPRTHELGRLHDQLHLSTVAKQAAAQRFPALFAIPR